jgi:hypothetical protein
MTTPDVLLLILAIAFLVFSFALVDKEKKAKGKNDVNGGNKENTELSEEDIKELKEQINKLLTEEVSNAVIDADDKMSKISNEKIIAVNEFSTQILEKIEQNNNEVVFLFNMLTQKEEDIKATYSKMETIRRENKEFLEKLSALMANKNKAKEQVQQKDLPVNALKQTINTDKNEGKVETSNLQVNNEDDAILFINDTTTSTEVLESNRNEEILRLNKNKKTILEISKQLNMGQGEVKLVIDLYAKK